MTYFKNVINTFPLETKNYSGINLSSQEFLTGLGLRPDLNFYNNPHLVTQFTKVNRLRAKLSSVGNLKVCAIFNTI